MPINQQNIQQFNDPLSLVFIDFNTAINISDIFSIKHYVTRDIRDFLQYNRCQNYGLLEI